MTCPICRRGLMLDSVARTARCYRCCVEMTAADNWQATAPFAPIPSALLDEDVLRCALIFEASQFTQVAVAKRIGISATYISEILRGSCAMPKRVAYYYGLRDRKVYEAAL